MKKTKSPDFKEFVRFFPKVELPIQLNEEDHHTFSTQNKPLPLDFIERFISPYEKEASDEFTEYVPCFRLPDTKNFIGLVYWRAKLMDYHYMLNTYEKDGSFKQSIHIGGTRTDGKNMARLVCTIKDKGQIEMVAGSAPVGEKHYDPKDSKVFVVHLDEGGRADIEMNETLLS
ncbi:MAG: hypothetical protein R3275_04070 [Saprospiraceae bacterium]|nr:hypothetical protein [Saprospiraceae bacterium]